MQDPSNSKNHDDPATELDVCPVTFDWLKEVQTTQMRGRKSKLTPTLHEALIRNLRAGAPIKTACSHVGVSYQGFRLWEDRGNAEKERLDKDPKAKPLRSEKKYLEFAEAVTAARAEAELRNITIIQRAASEREVSVVTRTQKRIPMGVGKERNLVEVDEVVTSSHREIDWRAAAWFLERSFPERWGSKQAVEHSGKIQHETRQTIKIGDLEVEF